MARAVEAPIDEETYRYGDIATEVHEIAELGRPNLLVGVDGSDDSGRRKVPGPGILDLPRWYPRVRG
jgi:hypothetical protein